MKNLNKTCCGFVAIIGRSMVGKSTLLNKLVKKKISITSRKVHTTRYSIFGVRTEGKYQAIYIDTPGIHINNKHIISRLINKTEISSISNVELIIFVVEGVRWTLYDEAALHQLYKKDIPVILVVNKVDLIQDKAKLLPHFQFLSKKMKFLDIIPISAKKGINVDDLIKTVHKYLPEADHRFSRSYITNCSKQFIASEIIREKLIRFLWKELPYTLSVKSECFFDKKRNNYNLNGFIFVEREEQKKIVIGRKGMKIKKISIEARKDMKKAFGIKIYLRLWVKVKNKRSSNDYIQCNLAFVNGI